MKYKLFTLILFLCCISNIMRGQDSINPRRFSPVNYSDTKTWVALTATGAGLSLTGTIADATKSDWQPTYFAKEKTTVADFVQYTPAAFPWLMKMCGSPTRSGWGRMAVSHGASVAIMAASISIIKDNHPTLRPDASDMRSFPSGHSAWAYLGATLTARELAWRNPWYAIGAYSVASALAMQRIIDRRHMPCDVVAGAGIGILSAQAGYYIGDIISGERQLENKFSSPSAPNVNTPSISLINTFSIPLSNISLPGVKITPSPAFETSIKGCYPIADNWGIALSANTRSTPIFAETADMRTYVAPLNSVGASIAPYYYTAISNRISLEAEITGRYDHIFSLQSISRDIYCSHNSFGGKVNVSITFRISDEFCTGASIGYELQQYDFGVKESNTYGISDPTTENGILHSIAVGVSTQIKF